MTAVERAGRPEAWRSRSFASLRMTGLSFSVALEICVMSKAKHVGIVACSAEGAALCYRTLCVEGAELMGRHNHPEVSLHTHPLAAYMECIYAGAWEGVAELMLSSAEKLAKTGAEFLICPDNTIHQAMPMVLPRSPLPWLHIAEAVAEEAALSGSVTPSMSVVQRATPTSSGRML